MEIQQENEGASPKRARYHAGLMDMNTLNPGEDFDELPECHVIFITQKDVLRRNLPIYHIDRTIREIGENFGDESHIIYVNSSRQEDTPLGRLMHDFHCKSAADIRNDVLAKRVRELKETQEGVEHMCKEMDQIYQEGAVQGRIEGEMTAKKDMAMSLAGMGLSAEKIAEAAKVSVQLVQEWLMGKTDLAK